jgi:hypothetical protein
MTPPGKKLVTVAVRPLPAASPGYCQDRLEAVAAKTKLNGRWVSSNDNTVLAEGLALG